MNNQINALKAYLGKSKSFAIPFLGHWVLVKILLSITNQFQILNWILTNLGRSYKIEFTQVVFQPWLNLKRSMDLKKWSTNLPCRPAIVSNGNKEAFLFWRWNSSYQPVQCIETPLFIPLILIEVSKLNYHLVRCRNPSRGSLQTTLHCLGLSVDRVKQIGSIYALLFFRNF